VGNIQKHTFIIIMPTEKRTCITITSAMNLRSRTVFRALTKESDSTISDSSSRNDDDEDDDEDEDDEDDDDGYDYDYDDDDDETGAELDQPLPIISWTLQLEKVLLQVAWAIQSCSSSSSSAMSIQGPPTTTKLKMAIDLPRMFKERTGIDASYSSLSCKLTKVRRRKIAAFVYIYTLFLFFFFLFFFFSHHTLTPF
jgi:hypothetical protein